MLLAVHYKANSALLLIYTKETCEEFHYLLYHLLCCYKAALLTLADFKGLNLSNDHLEAFKIAIYSVATCGLTLYNLIYSSFIEEYLSRIHLFNPHSQWCGNAGSVVDHDADGDKNGDGELDSELASVQSCTGAPGFRLSVTKAYIAWLWLTWWTPS
jgi:hypothetical protein